MAITNPVGARDVVFIQRSNDNTEYGQVHISGSMLIFYTDENGVLTADKSGSFYTKFPPSDSSGGGSGTTLFTGSTYEITSSWADHAVSASWAPGGAGSGTTLETASTYQITSSWAHKSVVAISSSWASQSIWATTSSSASNSSWATSASFASQSFSANSSSCASVSFWSTSASFSSESIFSKSGSYSSISFWATSASFASRSLTATSSSWASESISSSSSLSSSSVTGTGSMPINMVSAKFPATSSARLDSGENGWRLLFDAGAPQSASWQFLVPSDYIQSASLKIAYAMNGLQSGTNNVIWKVNLYCPASTNDFSGSSNQGFIFTSSLTNNQVAGLPTYAEIALSSVNVSMSADTYCWLNLERMASATSDTATTDAEVMGMMFKYIK